MAYHLLPAGHAGRVEIEAAATQLRHLHERGDALRGAEQFIDYWSGPGAFAQFFGGGSAFGSMFGGGMRDTGPKKARTISVSLASHNSLTKGALGCFHPYASLCPSIAF